MTGETVSERLGLDKQWIEREFKILMSRFSLFPKMNLNKTLRFANDPKYDPSNIKKHGVAAFQSLIENHLWPQGKPFPVSITFLDLDEQYPGRAGRNHNGLLFVELAKSYRNSSQFLLGMLLHEYCHVYHFSHAYDLIIKSSESEQEHLKYECLTDLCTVIFGMGEVYKAARTYRMDSGKTAMAGYLSDELLDYAIELYQRHESARSEHKVMSLHQEKVFAIYTAPSPTCFTSDEIIFVERRL